MYDRIRTLCDKNNISVAQLEKEMGLGNGTIGKWKSCAPRADVLLAIAERLGTTVKYLLKGGEGTGEKQTMGQ